MLIQALALSRLGGECYDGTKKVQRELK